MKLFILLNSFSSEEWRGAKKAVQSSIFNSNKRIEALFDFLRKSHPTFPETTVFKEKIYKKIYPKTAYNDYKLRRVFSELREVLEDYLLHAELKKDDYRREIALTKIYGDRNLYDVFKKKTEQLVQKIEEYPFPDTQMFLDKAILMKSFYSHNGTAKLKEYNYLVEAMEALHQYYLGERIITKLTFQTLNKTWSIPLELSYEKELEPLESLFSEEKSLNHLIYAKIFELVATDDDELYKEINELFEANINKFTKVDSNAIFRSLTNYCITKINLGDKYFNNHLLSLYEKGLESKILFDKEDKLTQMTYKNIGIVAIRAEKFEWAENFIFKYEEYVYPVFREELKNLVLGSLYFAKKDFDKSIHILMECNFSNINDIITSKSLLLRAYFELFLKNETYYSMFQSYNNAFYKYLIRSSISEEKKSRHLKLVSFTKRIATELNSPVEFKIEKWQAELEVSEDFSFKRWCKNKLSELKERR